MDIDSITTMRVAETVLIGDNPQFHALCRALRENRETLVRANICIPLLESDEHLGVFVECMGTNHTVESLTMIIPEDFILEAGDARRLGEMMAQQAHIKNLVLSNFSPTRQEAMDVFWQGVGQSMSLSVLAVHGLDVSQCGIPEARQIGSLQGLILDKCSFDHEGTDAFMGLLEQGDSSVVMIRIDRCIMGTMEKLRIAKSLAEGSTLPAFSLDVSLDSECTDAFAEAIAKNSRLRHVEFHGCCDRTLKVLTKVITENPNIMSAKVSSQDGAATALATTCQVQINHYTTLNRAGRKYLREDVERPNQENIEAFWFRILMEHQQDNDLVFTLLRDYPTLFLRALGLWDHCDARHGSRVKRIPDEFAHEDDDCIAHKRMKSYDTLLE